MLNPNQGYKKIVQKLKGRYKVSNDQIFMNQPYILNFSAKSIRVN